VVANPGTDAFSAFTLDLVIFDSGTIVRRLAIELAPIRPAKTSVKVFDIAQTTCGAIGSILVNDVTHCRDASGDVADCVDRISTSSKLPVTLSKYLEGRACARSFPKRGNPREVETGDRGCGQGCLASCCSPPGKRPNAHALPSAVAAAAYLGVPAGADLIEALMRGILLAIWAEAAEPLGSVAGKSFAAPNGVRHRRPISERREQTSQAV
jgi:hypothetical protein